MEIAPSPVVSRVDVALRPPGRRERMAYTSRGPSRLETKSSRAPSGDQTGLWLNACGSTRRIGAPPAAGNSTMALGARLPNDGAGPHRLGVQDDARDPFPVRRPGAGMQVEGGRDADAPDRLRPEPPAGNRRGRTRSRVRPATRPPWRRWPWPRRARPVVTRRPAPARWRLRRGQETAGCCHPATSVAVIPRRWSRPRAEWCGPRPPVGGRSASGSRCRRHRRPASRRGRARAGSRDPVRR